MSTLVLWTQPDATSNTGGEHLPAPGEKGTRSTVMETSESEEQGGGWKSEAKRAESITQRVSDGKPEYQPE
jgi:hypothetical protein